MRSATNVYRTQHYSCETLGPYRDCPKEEVWGCTGRVVGPFYESMFDRLRNELGIQKCIGWHTFRHTYSTLLRSVGTEFKVMQELLRHSTLRSTLDVYTQAITPAKHAAQAAVMSLVFSCEANANITIVGIKELPRRGRDAKGTQKGHENVPFWVLDGFGRNPSSLLE